MYILGISYGAHDPSAALLKDGRIVAAVEEERFTRMKHAYGQFPVSAIKFCLDFAGIALKDIDFVACPFEEQGQTWRKTIPYLIRHAYHYRKAVGEAFFYELYIFMTGKIRRDLQAKFKQNFQEFPKVRYIPHDVSHLASAYYASPFNSKDAMIMDIEGRAEIAATTFASADNGSFQKISQINVPDSLGHFYATFTEQLGFKAFSGEGKVMGLAPYGKPVHDLQDAIILTDLGYKYNTDYGVLKPGKKMLKRFGRPKMKDVPFNKEHENLAASVQKRLEEAAVHLLNKLAAKVDSRNFCIAGGVALNCKMNGVLWRTGIMKEMFVQPIAYDAGVAIGAAMEAYKQLGKKPNHVFEHIYFGPEYTNEQIKKILDECKLKYKYYDDIAGVAGELLAKNKLIGWFQGRMEMGARALGNRSILASPLKSEMKDIINKRVKHREPFRPFCPSMTFEAKEEYLDKPSNSPYMIMAYQIAEGKEKEIPAVVHVDGSIRPQTLKRSYNERFYKLISSFESETGVPVVLNTSFNVRGEPIVCTPYDALRCFYGTGLDYLALGNYLIKKEIS